ncbi:hypothetical protein ACTA71_009197 [Dictyostelium dimigraforme]
MVAINEEFIKKNILDENANIFGACIIGAPECMVLSKLNFEISNDEVKRLTEVFTLFRETPLIVGGKTFTRTKSTSSYILSKNDTTGIALFQNNMGLIAVAKFLDNSIEPERLLKILQGAILKALL